MDEDRPSWPETEADARGDMEPEENLGGEGMGDVEELDHEEAAAHVEELERGLEDEGLDSAQGEYPSDLEEPMRKISFQELLEKLSDNKIPQVTGQMLMTGSVLIKKGEKSDHRVIRHPEYQKVVFGACAIGIMGVNIHADPDSVASWLYTIGGIKDEHGREVRPDISRFIIHLNDELRLPVGDIVRMIRFVYPDVVRDNPIWDMAFTEDYHLAAWIESYRQWPYSASDEEDRKFFGQVITEDYLDEIMPDRGTSQYSVEQVLMKKAGLGFHSMGDIWETAPADVVTPTPDGA